MPPPDLATDRDLRAGRAVASDVAMHPRFEINLIVNQVIGERPEVRILQIAWYDKRRHLRHFLSNYHTRFGALPRGCHDLGETEGLGLGVGVIDFDRVRSSVEQDLRRKARSNARRADDRQHDTSGPFGWLRALLDRWFSPPSRIVRTRPGPVPDARPRSLAIRR